MNKEIISRFFRFVKKTSTCWIWEGWYDNRINKLPYGRFWLNGKNEAAHRVSYMIHKGKISIDKLVCHKCDTPRCVRPGHLFLGTQKDNMQDAKNKIRLHEQRVTKCPKGHEYSTHNTKTYNNKRTCVKCIRSRNNAAYWRDREKILQRVKRYYEANKEARKAYAREYWHKNNP